MQLKKKKSNKEKFCPTRYLKYILKPEESKLPGIGFGDIGISIQLCNTMEPDLNI